MITLINVKYTHILSRKIRSKISSNINDYNMPKILVKRNEISTISTSIGGKRVKRIRNNAKKGTFPVTKYPVHDRRRPNRSRGRSLYTYRESKVAPCRRVGKRFASGVAMERGKKERKGRKIIMNISINRVPSISNEIMHGGLSFALAHRFFKRGFHPRFPSP